MRWTYLVRHSLYQLRAHTTHKARTATGTENELLYTSFRVAQSKVRFCPGGYPLSTLYPSSFGVDFAQKHAHGRHRADCTLVSI